MSATAPGRREMLWWHQARHCIVRLRLGASGRSAVGKGEAAPSEDEAAPSGSRLPASRAWLQAQRQEKCSMKRSMRPRGRRVVLRASPALRWGSFVALLAAAFRSLSPSCHCPPSLALAHSRAFQGVHLTIHGPSHTHTHTHTTHVRSQPCTLNAIATRRSPPSSAPSSSLSTLCESHEGKSTCLRARLLRLGGCG